MTQYKNSYKWLFAIIGYADSTFCEKNANELTNIQFAGSSEGLKILGVGSTESTEIYIFFKLT